MLDIRDKIVSEVERFRRAEMKKKGKHFPDKRIAVNSYERKFEELREMIPKPPETYPIWALREHVERN